jgi:hypothetical protein
LLRDFEAWLVARPHDAGGDPAGVAGDVALALDWKWSDGDGDLGRWTTGDVAEFLLGWCPRKLSGSPADSASIPPAVAAFTSFLAARGLLAGGSSPAALAATASSLADEFVAAMGDPSNLGLAKSLFGAAAADGIEITDERGVQEWIDEFNARPFDERARILPDSAFRAAPPVPVPATAPALRLPRRSADRHHVRPVRRVRGGRPHPHADRPAHHGRPRRPADRRARPPHRQLSRSPSVAAGVRVGAERRRRAGRPWPRHRHQTRPRHRRRPRRRVRACLRRAVRHRSVVVSAPSRGVLPRPTTSPTS